jgi:hypothetical protein
MELVHYRRPKLGSLNNSEPNRLASDFGDEVLRECSLPDLLSESDAFVLRSPLFLIVR